MASVTTPPVSVAPTQGVMERRDPLPVGRYWCYIDQSEVGKWGDWVAANPGKVKVLVTEAQKSLSSWLPAIFQTRWDLDVITSVVGEWILFDVTAPVKWVGLGYPTTVIDPNVKSSTDVSTAPAPEPDANPLGVLYGDLRTLLLLGGGLYVAVQAFALVRASKALGGRS